jgi:LysM repeat protein
MANGSFFPIMDESATGRKKLILTTVNDEQESVQIDLYRGKGKSLENASYLGSLIIEDIEEAKRGDPEIELIMGIDPEGNLNASAGDVKTGKHQTLSVSLEALSEEESYDFPEFELDETLEPEPEPEPEFEEEPELEGESFGVPDYEEEEEGKTVYEEESYEQPRRIRPLLLVGFIILGLIIIGLIAFLFFRSFQGEEVPPLESKAEKTEQVAEADSSAEKKAEGTAGTEEQGGEQTGSGAETQKKTAEAGDGVWYTIRPGDTLWDISSSFYRTPWLFNMLARVNDIEDPDLIYAGDEIFIPER